MIIEKKTWPTEFAAILKGKKKFDVRLNDFKVKEGDILILREYDPKTQKYTGRTLEKKISYVLKTKNLTFWPKDTVEKRGLQIFSLE